MTSPAPIGPATRATTIDASALRHRLAADKNLPVIDVRTGAEFESVHIAGSSNIPLPLLTEHTEQVAAGLRQYPEQPVVLVCQSGVRAEQARQRLATAGVDTAVVLTGGVPGYAAAGGDLVRGTASWALERQVRLVAGGLVATSILASLRFPEARFLAGGIGAGLATAAITDTCAMGAALSKLPYNRGDRPVALPHAVQALRAAGGSAS